VTRVLADDLVPLQTAAEGRFRPEFLAALDAGLTVRPQQRPQSIAVLRALMDGTAVPDDTLTAPPSGQQAAALSVPAAAGQRHGLPQMAEPENDTDKTRNVNTRDRFPRTASNTVSTPSEPALAPIESATTPDLTGDPTFEQRFPSRSMQEHEEAISRPRKVEDDSESRLPLIFGVIAIAAVIAVAWVIINWLNGDIARSRHLDPAYPTPAPAKSSSSGTIVAPPTIAAARAPVAAAARSFDHGSVTPRLSFAAHGSVRTVDILFDGFKEC
jgi:hypothetical protein